jgi:carbon storage regulator
MLILSRKINESIVIDGQIVVKIVRIDGDQVKLGIEAPNHIPVHRHEVYTEILKNNQEAVTRHPSRMPRLPAAITLTRPTEISSNTPFATNPASPQP